MNQSPVRQLIDAARARIAADGMRGLRLRTIAQDVGISLGSLSYRIGDKAALFNQLLAQEHLDQLHNQEIWRARGAALNLATPKVLSAVITAWFEDRITEQRISALTECELLLEAGANPGAYSGIAVILDAQDAFWRDILLAHVPPGDAELFGRVIANYIRDELPFSLAAGSSPDYRLLRAMGVECLASRLCNMPGGLSAHFHQIVAACGSDSADVPLVVDLVTGTKRAEIAAETASVIAEQGVAAVSHRAVAARAGVSNSSVAHYFRTRTELLDAGFGALVLRMREEIPSHVAPARPQSWAALMRSTHAIALAAARDPHLMPFALDMRRRRAENGRDAIRAALSSAGPIDDASVQVATLVLVGNFLAAQARGGASRAGCLTIEDVARLRQRSGTQVSPPSEGPDVNGDGDASDSARQQNGQA